jgi:hypothetical protein
VTSSRIPFLDRLRALSFSFVLLSHFPLSAGFPIHRSWWKDAYAPYGVVGKQPFHKTLLLDCWLPSSPSMWLSNPSENCGNAGRKPSSKQVKDRVPP